MIGGHVVQGMQIALVHIASEVGPPGMIYDQPPVGTVQIRTPIWNRI